MTTPASPPTRAAARRPARDARVAPPQPAGNVTLVELLDRVLDRGVVLSGDITLAVADVDLVRVGLRLLIASEEAMRRFAGSAQEPR
jgi:gas vesicle structural protein